MTEPWQEQLSKVGVEGWRRAMTAKGETHDQRWREYQAWARTTRGRVVLFWRRLKRKPSAIRYALAALFYPGDLRGDLDDR